MTRGVNNYKNSKIYALKSPKYPNDVYIGYTTLSLPERLYYHLTHSKETKSKHYKVYQKITDWNDWNIELIENYPCNSKREILEREGHYIRLMGTLNSNKNLCGEEKKEKEKEYGKDYRLKNQDKLKNYSCYSKEKWHEYYENKKQSEKYISKCKEKLLDNYENKLLRYIKPLLSEF